MQRPGKRLNMGKVLRINVEDKNTQRQTRNKISSKCPQNKVLSGKGHGQGLSSCLITTSPNLRIPGGANDPAQRRVGTLPRTDSECQFKAPGILFMTEKDTTLSTHEVKMFPLTSPGTELRPKHVSLSKLANESPKKHQKTQTLYRESSAQTLPYLPEVFKEVDVQELELFSLPTVLPGENPPGLYETEVLERAKRRWALKKALNTNIKTYFRDVRTKILQYKPILEALEWEQWIQREEYIQECQMMRLEIVIKMFNKREKEMHSASKSRIEKACEEIEKRRQASLYNNERQFNKALRKLDAKRSKWRKESPLQALGSPCSEFYAPLLRHGVDPARRSYVPKTKRKAFDMRIDELEKKVNMKNLKCPFTTLLRWSKPKEYVQEYEQNFCNERNLQNLFESLKKLRTEAVDKQDDPRCLIKRRKADPKVAKAGSIFNLTRFTGLYDTNAYYTHQEEKVPVRAPRFVSLTQQQIEKSKKENTRFLLENILNIIEGTFLGYVMQFLSDEMSRLREQQKLHRYCMAVQQERWRREAKESGLRQKENHMRLLYDELLQHCAWTHSDVSNNYIEWLLEADARHCAEQEAVEMVVELSQQIDADMKKWMESFREIQNPLNRDSLRKGCMDIFLPDPEGVLRDIEITQIVQHVVEDVLFPRIWEELGPFDIGTTLASDLIDRLIDNDLYLFSTDSEDPEIPENEPWNESRAIIRKLIRGAVQEQSWKGEVERIAVENYKDLFDDVINQIIFKMENLGPTTLVDLHSTRSHNIIQTTDDIREREMIVQNSETAPSLPDTELIRMHILSLIKKLKWDTVTGNLENKDKYNGEDFSVIFDTYLKSQIINPIDSTQSDKTVNDIFSVLSSMDIHEDVSFNLLKSRHSRMKEERENHKEQFEESECLSSETSVSSMYFSERQLDENSLYKSLIGETKSSRGTPNVKHSRSTKSLIQSPNSEILKHKVYVSLDSILMENEEQRRGSETVASSPRTKKIKSESEIKFPNPTSTRPYRDDKL
ncbi:uncharacterized protein Dana_GF28057 [Drosophila ananassae]|uniref:Cilia- and flagella-associated protein 91 n=1 Tax=Drosophila ananassae TaxID=7217 RepID=A0A0P9BMV7_DROAN|nr:uncharacterized protein LOC26515466 [Drosophila ananassae]KPU73122.1 uncharacterized protein Dana_GF28057 [Drosophila ananassae]